jgi:hypothetical protein
MKCILRDDLGEIEYFKWNKDKSTWPEWVLSYYNKMMKFHKFPDNLFKSITFINSNDRANVGVLALDNITFRYLFKLKRERKMSKPKLGSGARFKAIEKSAKKSGASDPAAVAAAAGIKKYGKEKMAKMAQAAKNKKK